MSRADLHCHSAASEVSKLGVQRELGLPECATPPEEVYALAKRRGMDFVTITDHDTIAGVLEIADRPDVFVSEELTARFRGEPQAVHVLCLGITPADHEWLQAHAGDVETVAAYLHEHEIACALAHPFYAVEAPLTAAPPAPARGAVPDLGGPQRRARPRAQPAGRDLHRHPRRDRDRRLGRPRRGRHRAHVVRDPAGRHTGGVPRPRARRPRRRLRRPGLGGQVGARGDGARRPVARPRRRRRDAARPGRGDADDRADRGQGRDGGRRPRAARRAGRAARVARGRRARRPTSACCSITCRPTASRTRRSSGARAAATSASSPPPSRR